MSQPTKIIVNGAYGKMGQEIVRALQNRDDFLLVGTLDRASHLTKAIQDTQPDIVIDFTSPDCVFNNVSTILEHNIRPVIGTTGLTQQQISQLQEIAFKKKIGGVIAPNFSIAATLTIQFAMQAAKYFSHVEIIEKHHAQKKDAPSGTAIKAAEMIAKSRVSIPKDPTETETVVGSRGAEHQNIHIHALRLPGLVAHLEVIFGSAGETLTLSHDTSHRECFMPGVILACQKAMQLQQLVYGLENILD